MMLDPSFFQMDSTCIRYWHTVVDNLMTHDKTTYKDLMCKFLSHVNNMMTAYIITQHTILRVIKHI